MSESVQTESIAKANILTPGVPRIMAIEGPGKGRSLALTRSLATAGRHATNDLHIDDPKVSGVHLELSRTPRGVRIRDAGSTNGTWLGAHRVTEIEVTPVAEIVVGDTLLRIEMDQEALAAPVSEETKFGELVARSLAMRELFATLERVSPKALSVLVQGETGTGKEEVARAIHAASGRTGAFIVIDATALPETLAEAVLFGHEKGAFTGAVERRVGLFEAANGGTVLIDEIGELPQALQSKFLRVLERHEVVRIGSSTPVPVDVRVIAATHRDLRNEIEAGRFREDLYFRVAQVRVQLPPLRDRSEDVAAIAAALLDRIGGGRKLAEDAIHYLESHPWPGNVRELKNVLSRGAALAAGPWITRSDVAGEGAGFRGTREERAALDLSGTFAEAKGRAIERFEAAYLSALLKRCGGNLSKASREGDVARHHLRELLKKRGLYGIGD